MEKQKILIDNIPAILWGPATGKLFIGVHGDQSNKEDIALQLLAEAACRKGYQVLSVDLPEHGDRKDEQRQCNAQNCVEDLRNVMTYARKLTDDISLFGCSMGAYFSMLAYRDEPIRQALLLSPIVDMERLIRNMMRWFDVSEERLESEKEIPTPAKTLYWDYFQYVLAHPVIWNKPTAVFYGKQDELTEYEVLQDFVHRTAAHLTVAEDGGHYFHSPEHLNLIREWLDREISN
jgi:alpha-beta hydrolase superfamily lysophospholipase